MASAKGEVEVIGSGAMLDLCLCSLLSKCLMKRMGRSAIGQYLRWMSI